MIVNNIHCAIINYNKSKYLKTCLDSLPNYYEYSIIDDCSTDNSLEIISNYNINKYNFKENKGASACRNFLINKTNKKYILFLDSDDYFIPHQNLNDIIDDSYVYCFPYFLYLEKWNKQYKVNVGYNGPNRQISSLLIRRDVLEHFKFDEKLKNLEDFDLIYRLSKKFKFKYVERPYYVYNKNNQGKRLHGEDRQRLLNKIIKNERNN